VSDVARHPWWLSPVAVLGTAVMGLLGATWRVEWIDTAERDAALARGETWIFALWHSRLLALTWLHRHRDAGVLISRHRDGELIARVVRRLGYHTPRGSSTRGGEAGTLEMLRLARAGHLIAFTPDGPRGPAEKVKDGVVWLASRSGLPVVPAAAASRPEWRMRSWDGFRVPRPFARVVVGYGAPVRVPPDLDEAGLAHWRSVIEEGVAAVTRRMDERVRGDA